MDAIHPLLNDVMESLNKNPSLPPDFEGKTKMKNWYPLSPLHNFPYLLNINMICIYQVDYLEQNESK